MIFSNKNLPSLFISMKIIKFFFVSASYKKLQETKKSSSPRGSLVERIILAKEMRSKYTPPIVYSWIERGAKGLHDGTNPLYSSTNNEPSPPSHSFHHLSLLPVYPSIYPPPLSTIDRRRNSSQSRLNDGRASRNWRNIVVQITEATKRLELQIALGGEKAPLGLGPDRVHLPGINIQIRSCWQTNLHTNLVWPRPENRLIVRLRVHRERVVPSRFLVLQIFDLPRFLVFEIFGLWDFWTSRFMGFEIFGL